MSQTQAGVRRIRVWDLPTRLFHWTLLVLILAAWFTGEGEGDSAIVHRLAGEAVAGLIVFRLIWGFVGGEHARFADFAAGPAAIVAHIRDLFSSSPKRHLGHNPLGGVAVFLLLIVSLLVAVTGLFSSGEGAAGPFAGLLGLNLGEAHEALFRVLQVIVVLHVAGVALESVRARDALVPAMISGFKWRRSSEAGVDAKRAKPAALLVAVLTAIAVSTWLIMSPPAHVAPTVIEHEIDD